ncbi:hypothetical protein [Thermoplasma sp.]|uniref:hypothetical protein n=1 Tax=Thermoplasma sp. TaxID=1973142 RepID=UPI001273B18F|nr:hypothetical protein [Thermoplasma sp.]KAA8922685.1 MAG: hypothetical protein F6Q11_03540 [Thermoplasma sp.]
MMIASSEILGMINQKPALGRFKIAIPREHGLIVVWANTMIISIISSYRPSAYGIITFLIMLTTFFIYDPVLSALRIWKAGRNPLKFLAENHLHVVFLGFLLLAWIAYIAVIGVLPYTSMLAFAIFLIVYAVLFRYGERKLYTRILSILTLTSMFLIVSSAFQHSITMRILIIFLILSTGEMLMGSGPVEIANSRIMKIRFERLFAERIVPVYVSSMILILPVLILTGRYAFYVFASIFTVAAASDVAMKNMPMKRVGFIATGFNIAILISILVIYR